MKRSDFFLILAVLALLPMNALSLGLGAALFCAYHFIVLKEAGHQSHSMQNIRDLLIVGFAILALIAGYFAAA
ncbi:MAG: hypothetical protein ABJL99_17030 [Aliishimia sp.]